MFCPACGRPHAGECDKMVLLKNERDYIAQIGILPTTVAALDWATAEIRRLSAVLVQIRTVCDDNAADACDKTMALKFIRDVATKSMGSSCG
jgi:hypothetical protein